MNQTCTKCNIEKEINAYRSKKYQLKTGIDPIEKICFEKTCKICTSTSNKNKKKELKINDPDKYNEQLIKAAIRDKIYYDENKNVINEKNNKYYEANKLNVYEQRKKFRTENPQNARDQRKRFMSNPNNLLAQSLRRRVRTLLGTGKRAPELLGCTADEFKSWIQFNFDIDSIKGMTFENYGKIWELDHVMPCSKFNLEIEESKLECFNWKNIAPILVSENRIKNNRVDENHILRQKTRLNLFINRL